MGRPPARRRSRWVRNIVLAVGGIIVLAVAGIAVFVASFDPNSFKPQIIAAVQSATGRELTIGGRIGLSISLQPTLEVSDVSLSNPPGFSRPQMVDAAETRAAACTDPAAVQGTCRSSSSCCSKPDILLETNAQGQSNWDFGAGGTPGATPPAAPPEPLPPAAAQSSSPASSPASPPGSVAASPPPHIALSSLKIEGGRLAMRDAAGQTMTLALKQLTASEAAPDAPLHLTVDGAYNGAPVSLTADTGPLAGLLGGGAPWPVKLAATAAGAKFGVDGTVRKPAEAHGLAAALTADVPDLAAPVAAGRHRLAAAEDDCRAVQGWRTSMPARASHVTGVKLTLPQVDLAGSLSFGAASPPLVRRTCPPSGSISTLCAKPVAAVPPGGAGNQAVPAGADKQAAPPSPTARSGRVIPDAGCRSRAAPGRQDYPACCRSSSERPAGLQVDQAARRD